MKFGERLRAQRKQLNVTQEMMARELNVTRQTISNWENDKNYPDLTQLVAIATVYQLSLDQMFREDAEMVNTTQKVTARKGWRRGLLVGGLVLALIGASGIGYMYMEMQHDKHVIYTGFNTVQRFKNEVNGQYDIIGTKGWASFGTGNVKAGERYVSMWLIGGNHVDNDNSKLGTYKFVPHKVTPVKFVKGQARLTNFGTYSVPTEIPHGEYTLKMKIPKNAGIGFFENIGKPSENNQSVGKKWMQNVKYTLMNGKPYTGRYKWNLLDIKHPELTATMDIKLSNKITSLTFENWNDSVATKISNDAYTITLKRK